MSAEQILKRSVNLSPPEVTCISVAFRSPINNLKKIKIVTRQFDKIVTRRRPGLQQKKNIVPNSDSVEKAHTANTRQYPSHYIQIMLKR